MSKNEEYYKLFNDASAPETESESGDVRDLLWRKKSGSNKLQVFWRLLSCLLVVGAAAVLLYTAVTVARISKGLTLEDYGDCGASQTVEEARAKGCIFDPAAWIWTRPECFDKDLFDDFMKRNKFSYHTDKELTPESMLPVDWVMEGNISLIFTQNVYHLTHCTYMWKRMHNAILKKGPIDSYLNSWDHTKHCDAVLLNSMLHEVKGLECPPGDECATWLGKPQWTSCKRF